MTREKPDSTVISLTPSFSFTFTSFAIGLILTNPTKGGVKRDNSKEMIASLNCCIQNMNPRMDKIYPHAFSIITEEQQENQKKEPEINQPKRKGNNQDTHIPPRYNMQ